MQQGLGWHSCIPYLPLGGVSAFAPIFQRTNVEFVSRYEASSIHPCGRFLSDTLRLSTQCQSLPYLGLIFSELKELPQNYGEFSTDSKCISATLLQKTLKPLLRLAKKILMWGENGGGVTHR